MFIHHHFILFDSLKRRLSNDFGYEVTLKYEDRDGDFITMSSQDDLQDLLAYSHSDVVNVLVSESTSLPQLNTRSVSTAQQQRTNTMSRGGSDWPRPAVATPTQHHTTALPRLGQQQQPQPQRFPNIFQEADTPIRWKRAEILGQGAFGVVYLGLNIDTGELMAVKQMASEEVSRRELSSLENEINLLRNLRHPNIVRYIGTELTSTSMSIFLEYVPGGSLKALIDKFGLLEEAVARSYTRQLLLGLEYLHRNGIAHRDVKGANCLVGNDGVIKLADFGNSKHWRPIANNAANVPLGGTQSGDIKGTPAWMAPEVVRDQGSGTIAWRKADIWSLACTTLEMTTGRSPWSQFNNSVTILYHLACQETLPEYPPHPSTDLLTFLNVCFQRDAQLRPDITSLLLHPFVAPMMNSNNGGGWAQQRPTTMSSLMTHSDSNASVMALFPMPRRPTAAAVQQQQQQTQVMGISADQALAQQLLQQQQLQQQQHPQSARVQTTIRSDENTMIMVRDQMLNTARPAPYAASALAGAVIANNNNETSAFTAVNTSNPNSGHNSLNNSIAVAAAALTGSAAFVYYDQDPENTHELPQEQNAMVLLPTAPNGSFDEEIVAVAAYHDVPRQLQTLANSPSAVPVSLTRQSQQQQLQQSLSTKASRKSTGVSKKAQGRRASNKDKEAATAVAVAAPPAAQASQAKSNRGVGSKAVPVLEMKSLAIVSASSNKRVGNININRGSPIMPQPEAKQASAQQKRSPEPPMPSTSTGSKMMNIVYDSDDGSSCHTPWQQAYTYTDTNNDNEGDAEGTEYAEGDSILNYADDELGSINNDMLSLGTLETAATTARETSRGELQAQQSLPSIYEHSSYIGGTGAGLRLIQPASISPPQQQMLSARVMLHPIDPMALANTSGNNTARSTVNVIGVVQVQASKNLPALSSNKRHSRRQQQQQQQVIPTPSSEEPQQVLKIATQHNSNEEMLVLESIDKLPPRSIAMMSPVPPLSVGNNNGGGPLSPGQSRPANQKTLKTSSRISTGVRRPLNSSHQQQSMQRRDLSANDLLDMSCDSLESLHVAGMSVVAASSISAAAVVFQPQQHYIAVYEPPAALENNGKGAVDSASIPALSYSDLLSSAEPMLFDDHTAAVTRLRASKRFPHLLMSSSLDGTVRIWSTENSSQSSDDDSSYCKAMLSADLFTQNGTGSAVPAAATDTRRISLGPRQPSMSDMNSLLNDNGSVTNTSYDNGCANDSTKAMRISDFWMEDSCDTIWAVCSDGAIRVWSLGSNSMDYLSHRPLRLLKGHDDAITCLAGLDVMSSNGSSSVSLVATGSADRTIRLWDHRARRQQVFLFRGHGDTVLSLAWMEEGRAMVSSSKDRMIKVWDTRAGRLRCTMERHFGSVHTVRTNTLTSSSPAPAVDAASINTSSKGPSGGGSEAPAIISAGRDAMINFWSASGELLASQTAAHRGHTSFLSMTSSASSRSSLMVSAGADGLLKVWDARRPRGGCQAELLAPTGGVAKIAWASSPVAAASGANVSTQQSFVVAGSTGVVRLYEKDANSNNSAANYVVNDNGSSAAAAGSDWRLTELRAHTAGCTDVVCSDGMIAVAAKNGQILRWNVPSSN